LGRSGRDVVKRNGRVPSTTRAMMYGWCVQKPDVTVSEEEPPESMEGTEREVSNNGNFKSRFNHCVLYGVHTVCRRMAIQLTSDLLLDYYSKTKIIGIKSRNID
jgi:hypothetical protein